MSEKPAAEDAINEACHRLLTTPALRPLLDWWEIHLSMAALPPGPIDPLRLVMAQGDRERLQQIKARAAQHKTKAETHGPHYDHHRPW